MHMFENNTDDSIGSQTVAYAGRIVEPEAPTKQSYKSQYYIY